MAHLLLCHIVYAGRGQALLAIFLAIKDLFMHQRATSYNRLFLFYTLSLTYIGGGIMSILPGPTLSLLANNTHVSTAVAGWIFTSGAGGFALGVLLTGALAGKIHPKTI